MVPDTIAAYALPAILALGRCGEPVINRRGGSRRSLEREPRAASDSAYIIATEGRKIVIRKVFLIDNIDLSLLPSDDIGMRSGEPARRVLEVLPESLIMTGVGIHDLALVDEHVVELHGAGRRAARRSRHKRADLLWPIITSSTPSPSTCGSRQDCGSAE
jgi:hypothetical protein